MCAPRISHREAVETQTLAEKTPATQVAQLLSGQPSDSSGFFGASQKWGTGAQEDTGMGDTQEDMSIKVPR